MAENQVVVSCGLVVRPSTLAVSSSANLAPPITQAPIAASPSAVEAVDELLPLPPPSAVLTALPR